MISPERKRRLWRGWLQWHGRLAERWSPTPASGDYRIRRLAGNPIVQPGIAADLGGNVMGPCLVRVPDWVAHPLGRYYLYFSAHSGPRIRLAYADDLHGPWRIHPEAVLEVPRPPDGSGASHWNVAAPDVHVDPDRLRMYFRSRGATFLAVSGDGLRFQPGEQAVGPPYMRVFAHGGWHYAIAKPRGPGAGGLLLRSRDGLAAFEPGPRILPRQRHVALLKRGDRLDIFYSRVADCPERILVSRMALAGDWRSWRPGRPEEVARPETDYEGAQLAPAPSRLGAARQRVCELRDPALIEEDGRLYMVYAVAGEAGLAIAELSGGGA